MLRSAIIIILFFCSIYSVEGQTRNAVVVDSVARTPLSSASVFDRQGNTIGISDVRGRLPSISSGSYPITIRYLGFQEKVVPFAGADTIFLQENMPELPEIVVESRQYKVLHMLAYVREYSTLTTYADTVFLFREKMVDYMLPTEEKMKFKGWSIPRILTSKSYYRFTNSQGLDSVSNVSNHHFSWSDWVGVAPSAKLPDALRNTECGADTLRGRYSPTEIWTKNNGRVIADVNVLADTTSRKWVPNLMSFFRKNLDFENFRVRFNYDNIADDSIPPSDLTGYSFNIESNGRGRDMFRFNMVNEPFFVSTYAEVYMLDKEYITVKEAKKWSRQKFDTGEIGIYEPPEAPELQPLIQELVSRVNNINIDKVRLDIEPDQNLVSKNYGKKGNFNIERRVLNLLKGVTGISRYKMNRNLNRRWDEIKEERMAERTSQTKD